MRADTWFYAFIGLANASAILPRDVQDAALEQTGAQSANAQAENAQAANAQAADVQVANAPADNAPATSWTPKTRYPKFFTLKPDVGCTQNEKYNGGCPPLSEYGIRLSEGMVIATPYNRWRNKDDPLDIFFVDSDTQAYSVSDQPKHLYVNTVTGELKYRSVAKWLPGNSIAISFYKSGTNPDGDVDPSPAYFAWPTTEGRANIPADANIENNTDGEDGNDPSVRSWWFCPLAKTTTDVEGQTRRVEYQVYVNGINFEQAGIQKTGCISESLAAVNAKVASGHQDHF